MTESKFKIDFVDRSIIDLLQKDPNLTHMEIAEKINRSQPTVGMRIHKLEEKGLLELQRGVNFKKVDLYLVTVTIKTKDAEEIFEMARICPFIINAYKLSGENNVMLFLASSNLQKLDNMVNYHFRLNEKVSKVKMEVVVDLAKDLILPVDFRSEDQNPTKETCCGDACIKLLQNLKLNEAKKELS